MNRIGILGGTFNPIHYGHIAIAKAAYEQVALDEIWIMPSGNPPHKKKENVAPDHLRVAMIEAMIEDIPYMKCSTFEVDREETSYTAWTLTELCALYPKHRFYYIVGSDSLCYIENWHDAETIFDMAHLIAAYRSTESPSALLSHAEYLRRAFDAKVTLVHNDAVDISSTMIREYCKEGKELTAFVPQKVADIIKQNELYLK